MSFIYRGTSFLGIYSMAYNLPPGVDTKILGHIPARHRDDVIGEAWVGYLEAERDGGDPIAAARRAVWAYKKRETRYEKRRTSCDEFAACPSNFDDGLDEIVSIEDLGDNKGNQHADDMGLHYDQYHGWTRDDI